MTAPRLLPRWTRRPGHLPTEIAIAATAAATAWFALVSWAGLTEDRGAFLAPLVAVAIVVATTGAIGRWAGLPSGLVVLVQLLCSAATVSLQLTGTLVPTGPAWTDLVTQVDGAVDTANRYRAPVPTEAPGLRSLLVPGGWLCLLAVDLLAGTLRRAPLAGLPLLAVYSLPLGLVEDGVPGWVFGVSAVGFLLLLFVHHEDEVSRWSRSRRLRGDEPETVAFSARTGTTRGTATGVGAVSTLLALAVPALVPVLDLHLVDFGPGDGGDSEIKVTNPMTDLVRDLIRGEDTPLLRVRTDDPEPDYLRISVLTEFTGAEWRAGDRDVPDDQLPDGAMPHLTGVGSAVQRREHDYVVDVTDEFESRWLPTQAPISRIEAEGDWRYDLATMDFIAADKDLDTSGLSYSMTSVELDLSAAAMAEAPTSVAFVSPQYSSLPEDFPDSVRDLTLEVTRQAPTRFEKAVALQQWFRTTGGFTYDLTPSVAGNGTDALVDFLTEGGEGRRGYCEQFASAMAAMARVVGIPARVAVGFLEPEPLERGVWEYTAHDLHAWPELFFAGSGWVRFEPTPGGRAEAVPAYTTRDLSRPEDDARPGGREPESQAPDSPSARPTEAGPDATGVDGGDSGPRMLPVLGGVAGAAAVGGVLLLPRLLRRHRRHRRLQAGPEGAWAELRATALDLGVRWPEGRSPRETRDQVVRVFGRPRDEFTAARPAQGPELAPDAVRALDRLVVALERLRYAPEHAGREQTLRAEVETCVAALEGGATARARRLARWWPRSVLQRRPRRHRVTTSPTVQARYGGVVDRVG